METTEDYMNLLSQLILSNLNAKVMRNSTNDLKRLSVLTPKVKVTKKHFLRFHKKQVSRLTHSIGG